MSRSDAAAPRRRLASPAGMAAARARRRLALACRGGRWSARGGGACARCWRVLLATAGLRPVARDRLHRLPRVRDALPLAVDGRPPRLGGRADDAGLAGAADLARGPVVLARRRRTRPGAAAGRPAWLSALARGRALRLARGARRSSSCPSCSPACSCSPPPISWPTSAAAVGIGRWFGWYGEATFGRIVLLFLFNEIAIVGGGWLIDGHWTRSWRLRGAAPAQRRVARA